MKHFKYSIVDLIREIRERPAIWDKSLVIYKDREERKTAWDEIFRILEKDFDNLSKIERRSLGDVIVNKWTNVRDTFMRSLKNQTNKSGVRRYVHHEDLEFLLKVVPQEIIPEYDVFDDSITEESMKLEVSQEESEEEILMKEIEPMPFKKIKRKRKFSDIEAEPRSRKKRSNKSHTLPEPEENQSMEYAEDPRIMNEDEAYFASLLPSVAKYNESERLEFRIEVLAVMKSINEKRRKRHEED